MNNKRHFSENPGADAEATAGQQELGVVPRLLRVVGAGLLAASLSVFLFQGWQSDGDIQRYALLLAQTVLLSLTGLAIGRWLGEAKSARVFIALSLLAVVANFAVLGGLIYSAYQWDDMLVAYSGFAEWQADSGQGAIATTLFGLVLLLPLTWIGFLSLARRAAWPLSTVFLLANCALLLPVRDPLVIGALAAAGTMGILLKSGRRLARDPGLRTPEGIIAVLLTLLPPAVMLGRGLYLYSADALLATVSGGIGWLVLRELARSLPGESSLRVATEFASLPVAVATAVAAAVLSWDLGLDAGTWTLPIATFVCGGLWFELSTRAARYSEAHRVIAAALVVAGVIVNLAFASTTATAGVALVTGVGMVSYAAWARYPGMLKLGLIALVIGAGDLVRHAVSSVDLNAWGWLAVIGTVTMLAAAVLERYGTVGTWARLRDIGQRQ